MEDEAITSSEEEAIHERRSRIEEGRNKGEGRGFGNYRQ